MTEKRWALIIWPNKGDDPTAGARGDILHRYVEVDGVEVYLPYIFCAREEARIEKWGIEKTCPDYVGLRVQRIEIRRSHAKM